MVNLNKSWSLKPCTQAIIFSRVSTKEQESGASLNAQEATMKSYCAKKNMSLLKIFRAIENSTRGKRSKFHEMLDFVKKQKHKTALLLHCIDRFQRRFNECVEIESLLKQDKIELHFFKEGLILHKNSPSTDIMRWDMGILSGKLYIANLRDNVNRSMNYNWSKGKLQTKAPIGYLNVRNEEGASHVIKDIERAPIVIKMFEEYATGKHSLQSIHEFAKIMGLNSAHSKNKNIISRVTVHHILTNPFYYGEMCIRGNLIKHIYEPLIDKSLFDRVQNILADKKTHAQPLGYGNIPCAFRGLIKCPHCGHTISTERHKKKSGKCYIYLRCSCSQSSRNQKLAIEANLLQQLEEEVFNKININTRIMNALKKSVEQKIISESTANAIIKRKITNDLNKLTSRESRTKELFFDGETTKDEWEEEKNKIFTKKEELKKQADKHIEITNEIKDTINSVLDIAGSASMIMKSANPLKKRSLINLVIKDCYLEDGKLRYTIQKPFDKFIGVKVTENFIDFKQDRLEDLNALGNRVQSFKENMQEIAIESE